MPSLARFRSGGRCPAAPKGRASSAAAGEGRARGGSLEPGFDFRASVGDRSGVCGQVDRLTGVAGQVEQEMPAVRAQCSFSLPRRYATRARSQGPILAVRKALLDDLQELDRRANSLAEDRAGLPDRGRPGPHRGRGRRAAGPADSRARAAGRARPPAGCPPAPGASEEVLKHHRLPDRCPPGRPRESVRPGGSQELIEDVHLVVQEAVVPDRSP